METVNPYLGVLIVMNNYFHDVATGLMAAGAAALWVLMKRFEYKGNREAEEFLLDTYAKLSKLVRYSIYYILIAGVPRTYFYKSVEWATLAGEMQVTAIIIKHVLAFSLVGAGLYFRHEFNMRINEIRLRHSASPVAAGGAV